MWGDRDVVQGPASAAVATEALPNSHLEVLAGGHGLWFEHPQRCGELITGFLASPEPRQG